MPKLRYGRSRAATIGAGLALIASSAAGVLASPVAAGQPPTGHPTALGTLQKALDSFVRHPDSPPGIIVTLGNGKWVTVRTAGVANLVTKAPPRPTDHMRLASVAKAFSGAAALTLVSRGTLALSDTVGKWLSGMPKAWRPVTLRELLNHTSGIPDFSKSKDFEKALLASLQNPPPHRTLLTYAPPEVTFTPGTHYKYSNTDNILVALIVETSTHRSYESVLANRVYAPLGLTQTSLPNGSAVPRPTLRGYDIEPPPSRDDVTTAFAAGWTWASGGIVSTPAEALRFVRGYVSGVLTNRATRAAQFTFRPGLSEPPGPGTNSAGLALFRYQTSCGTVYGHTGNTAGYTQFVAASGDGRDAVTVSINGQLTPGSNPLRFAQLRHIYELAVCAAATADW